VIESNSANADVNFSSGSTYVGLGASVSASATGNAVASSTFQTSDPIRLVFAADDRFGEHLWDPVKLSISGEAGAIQGTAARNGWIGLSPGPGSLSDELNLNAEDLSGNPITQGD
jgi:hypothetical protein